VLVARWGPQKHDPTDQSEHPENGRQPCGCGLFPVPRPAIGDRNCGEEAKEAGRRTRKNNPDGQHRGEKMSHPPRQSVPRRQRVSLTSDGEVANILLRDIGYS
jgi:hypothetical protein